MNTPQNKSQNRGRLKPVIPPKSKKQQRPKPQADAKIIQAPVALSMRRRTNKPKVRPSGGNGDIRVAHREYISDVNGSIAFASIANSINPGLPAVFPWLSTIARNYESYHFRKLKFCYETESSTTTVGTLILSVDYDASDVAPDSKAQALSYRNSVRSAPWDRCCHESLLEDLSKLKSHFVRSAAVPTGADIKLYDIGTLFVCTQGETGTSVIGELYVEYDLELMTPQLNSLLVGSSQGGIWSNLVTGQSPIASSNVQASVVFTAGGSATFVWTFTAPYEGAISTDQVGTGLTLGGGFTGGTGTIVSQNSTLNAGATVITSFATFVAQPGQTIRLVVVNTTLASCFAAMTQGPIQ